MSNCLFSRSLSIQYFLNALRYDTLDPLFPFQNALDSKEYSSSKLLLSTKLILQLGLERLFIVFILTDQVITILIIMRVLALISGGKDSIFNICKCVEQGHEIVALANLYNENEEKQEGIQLDSYMYQTVGTNATIWIAQAMEKPLYRRKISGTPKIKTLEYDFGKDLENEGDEVEDLDELIKQVVQKHPQINAVSSGAIFSTYQKLRVQNMYNSVDAAAKAYLWQRQQKVLLQEMVDFPLQAIIIKIASYGLTKEHLGKTISQLKQYFFKLEQQCGMNVCGEGGQYESLVLDCQYYKKRIEVEEAEVIEIDKNPIAPVAYLRFKKLRLVQK